jgi:hypothetical protein
MVAGAGHREVGGGQYPGQHHERPTVLGRQRGRGQQGGHPEREPNEQAGRCRQAIPQWVTGDAEEGSGNANHYERGGQHYQ